MWTFCFSHHQSLGKNAKRNRSFADSKCFLTFAFSYTTVPSMQQKHRHVVNYQSYIFLSNTFSMLEKKLIEMHFRVSLRENRRKHFHHWANNSCAIDVSNAIVLASNRTHHNKVLKWYVDSCHSLMILLWRRREQ